NFAIQVDYTKESNSYNISLAREPDIDALNNQQFSVKNLVVLKMKSSVKAIDSGDGTIYNHGIAIPITWQQEDHTERLKLLYENGQEVNLNRGKTWFAVLPSSGTVND